MSPLASPLKAVAHRVRVTDHALTAALVDGRVVSVPTAWYPRLAEASDRERRDWVLIGAGVGIHWPALDEDVSVDGLLRGERSGESRASLRSWRTNRKRPAKEALQPRRRAAARG